jgi:hypothetical protein
MVVLKKTLPCGCQLVMVTWTAPESRWWRIHVDEPCQHCTLEKQNNTIKQMYEVECGPFSSEQLINARGWSFHKLPLSNREQP